MWRKGEVLAAKEKKKKRVTPAKQLLLGDTVQARAMTQSVK